MNKKKRISPLTIILLVIAPILLILVILLLIICFALGARNVTLTKQANDYKNAYETLIEEQKEAERSAAQYQAKYNQLISDMIHNSAEIENQGNLIVQVWNNAIFKKDDEITDKFTKVNGQFVSDFNDALGCLFNDHDFIDTSSEIKEKNDQIRLDMKDMVNPPDGYENAYQALKEYYESYLEFYDTVIYCDGSLESFSNKFNETDSECISKFNSAELYVQ